MRCNLVTDDGLRNCSEDSIFSLEEIYGNIFQKDEIP